MSFSALGDELKNFLKQNTPLNKQISASLISDASFDIFKEVLGEEACSFIKPLFLKNRTLTVSCLNSIIAQEIRLNHQIIIDKLNTKLGEKAVDRIRYLL